MDGHRAGLPGAERGRSKQQFRWLEVACAIGAVVVSLVCLGDLEHLAWGVVLFVAATVPFVLMALGVNVPPAVIVATAVPTGFAAVDGAGISIGAIPAVALLLAVPLLSRTAGFLAALFCAAVFTVVAVVTSSFDWIAVGVGMFAAWAGGVSFGDLRARVRELHVAGESAADMAVRAERRRLARELHDLVAHALTGTMLCLTEIRLVLDTDREAVLHALDEAERLARASLSDLRGTVRLLSEEGDPALEPPIELERDLEQLIDGYKRSGIGVEVVTEGDPMSLSVASSWAVYRIVQESLTNAVRHAPGCDVTITLRWSRDGVRVAVSNSRGVGPVPQRSDSGGRGVVGMSERAGLLGGWLEAGPTSTGWTVAAWIPVTPHAAIEVR